MPKFCANLTLLFTEVDFLDRFEAAAKAGFKGVEYLFPYDYDPDILAAKLSEHGLTQVLHNMPPGDWAAGERGIAILPDRIQEYREGVTTAIRYATALSCKRLHSMAGIPTPGLDFDTAYATYIDNLRYAAAETKKAGIDLLIEPINDRYDVPGYFLNTSDEGLQVIADVGADNLFLQYDIYHMQIMEGDLARTMEANLDRIAHMQLADTPGRHEPGTGEINYPFLFDRLDKIGYDGWIGCEYHPANGTVEGLGWMPR